MNYSEQPTKRIMQLANNGDPNACLELSARYATGTTLLKKDKGKAKEWKRRADEILNLDYAAIPVSTLTQWAYNNHNAKACIALADIYGKGLQGVPLNLSMAKYWKNKAEEIQPGITVQTGGFNHQSPENSKYENHPPHKEEMQMQQQEVDGNESDSKNAVIRRYRQFLNVLEDCYQDLNGLKSKDEDFAKIIDEVKNGLQGEIATVRHTATEAMNATVWDHLVIAFFGETNAGKSTIIETFRVLFNEKNRLESLKKNPEGVDGEIVGDGQSDFTKVYSEYDMSIKGHPFTLIDVPGIEGNEDDFKDEIKKALGKAHLVFYVQGHNKQPDTKTAEKIKKYLRDWVNVYSIYNVRGGSGNYNEVDERKTLFTPRVTQTADLISQTFEHILGKQYKGNISLQGLLALCAVAKFSTKREDLRRTQRKLEKYFDGKESILSFSGFEAIEQIVFEKSDNFADEIIEANKHKLIKLGKDGFHDIASILDKNEEDLKTYKNQLNGFRRYVRDRYGKTTTLIKQKVSAEYDAMFDRIRSNIYTAIDSDNTDEAYIRSILNNAMKLFNDRISKGIQEEKSNLRAAINNKKKSLDVLLLNTMVDDHIGMNLSSSLNFDDAFDEMDINFSDVLGLGAAVAAGAVTGSYFTFIAPGVATAVGGIIGGGLHILRKALFGDGGKGKAKEKVREQLRDAKNRGLQDINKKINEKVLQPLKQSRNHIESIVQMKENVFNSSLTSIDDCQKTLKKIIIGLNNKEYGDI